MARLTFQRMWSLVEHTFRYSHYLGTHYRTLIGPELIVAVSWEETLFENLAGAAGAVGFGQVQPKTIAMVNHFWEKEDGRPMTFVGREVLLDDIQAIQLAGLVMAMEYEKLVKWRKQPIGEATLRAAMLNYAGAYSEESEQRRIANARTALSWFDCRDALRTLHLTTAALVNPSDDLVRSSMLALNKTTRKFGRPDGSPEERANWARQKAILFPV